MQGDVYALGLVIWEVASRVSTPFTPCPPSQPPYWDIVGVDPSLDEMRKVNAQNQMATFGVVTDIYSVSKAS